MFFVLDLRSKFRKGFSVLVEVLVDHCCAQTVCL